MTKKQHASPIESVKASLRRKALDAQMQRGSTPKEKTPRKAAVKPEVPKEFFNPAGYVDDRLAFTGGYGKGVQPPWVKKKYGSNADE